MTKLALGLMSGTSADGLTICAVQTKPFRIVHFKNYPYPKKLQQKLLKAYTLKAPALSRLHYEIGQLYADLTEQFLKDFHVSADAISVIGTHGQTVYHGPHDKTPNTLQIGEPSFLAVRFGCPVVSDFRAMDIALGGEGAPLIPFFDQYIWGRNKTPVMLLNIGGIANLSVVGKNFPTLGFDVGPGNTLMDLLAAAYFRKPYDKDGKIAAAGTPDTTLVTRLLAQKFFRQKPPKSLDKNTFGTSYCKRYFTPKKFGRKNDLLATAAYFTAAAVAKAVQDFVPEKARQKLIISGGGCYNKTLLSFIRQLLPKTQVTTSQSEGIHPHAKESAAFAILADLALKKQINHCARATGAQKNSRLGKVIL